MTHPAVPIPGQLDDDSRLDILSQEINRRLMAGWLVVHRDDTAATAILSRPGKPVSHLLHLFLSIFTLGFWIPVWLLLTLFQTREKRVMVWIDPHGRCIEKKHTISYS